MSNEVETLRNLLAEGYVEYADHAAWRCEHPDRYPHDPDCPCLLTDWQRRVEKALGENPVAVYHRSDRSDRYEAR